MRKVLLKVVIVASGCVVLNLQAISQWEYIGLKGHTAYELRLHQGRLYAATDSGVFFHDLSTTDTIWVPVGLQGRPVNTILPITRDTIFAGTKTTLLDDTTSICRTTDGGSTWQHYQNGFGGDTEFKEVKALERLPWNTDLIFATGLSVIARSFNRGLDWEVSLGSWDAFGQATQFLDVDRSSSMSIWSGGETGSLTPVLSVSTDAGETWREVYPPLKGENACYSVAIDPINPDVVYAGTEGSVIKSTDAGQNWATVLAPGEYPYFFGLEISPSDPVVIYAAGATNSNEPQSLTLYMSETGGREWKSAAYENLTHGGVGNLLLERTVSSDVVYIATRTRDTTDSEGVFVFRNPFSTQSTRQDDLPQGYTLFQNYPNPANPSTTLRYAVPERSHVILTVVNALGQRIMGFEEERMEAGSYEQFFDASGLSSGTYFYRMEAASVDDPKKMFVQTRKMVLLR